MKASLIPISLDPEPPTQVRNALLNTQQYAEKLSETLLTVYFGQISAWIAANTGAPEFVDCEVNRDTRQSPLAVTKAMQGASTFAEKIQLPEQRVDFFRRLQAWAIANIEALQPAGSITATGT